MTQHVSILSVLSASAAPSSLPRYAPTVKSNWHLKPPQPQSINGSNGRKWGDTRAAKVMAGQAEQAVLDENQNKLESRTHIQIRGMMVERGVRRGEALDKLEQILYLHYCRSGGRTWRRQHTARRCSGCMTEGGVKLWLQKQDEAARRRSDRTWRQ